MEELADQQDCFDLITFDPPYAQGAERLDDPRPVQRQEYGRFPRAVASVCVTAATRSKRATA